MKYVITLSSKYTGEAVHLGVEYPTHEQAQEYADQSVCSRCNTVSIVPVPDEAAWINRYEGFRVRA